MRLDPRSAVVGAISAAALAATLSWAQTTAPPLIQQGQVPRATLPTALFNNKPILVAGIPTPQQMVRIEGGVQFIVPQGKLLVFTGMGSMDGPGTTFAPKIFINGKSTLVGHLIVEQGPKMIAGAGPALIAIPPGLVAVEGDVVAVEGTGTFPAIALGYLVDA